MNLRTADLCDDHADACSVAEPLFRDYGGTECFHGPIETVAVFEDNSLVRQALESKGNARVLVIDGAASLRCALFGDRLATLAIENGWAGVVVHGAIRDAHAIATLSLGVKALATCPRKSEKRGTGRTGITVRFAGVDFVPGHHVYADRDGIVVAARALG